MGRAVSLALTLLLVAGCLKHEWGFRSKLSPRPEMVTSSIRLGEQAPEIVGEDVEGRRLKLSDYRGEVVLLHFWGYWCTHCRAMLPHERSLVAKYEGKPFTIVGVNSDDDKAQLQQALARDAVTWPTICAGNPMGAIPKQYGVQSWPTTLLLDGKGVVRYANLQGPDLDNAIELLVCETQKSK